MLFNSIEFFLFLPTVFVLYWGVFGNSRWWQNLFVVAVSYVFYGWWDWRFLLLIALTSFCSWLSGLWMGEIKHEVSPVIGLRGHRKLIMVANILLNLSILGYFKYYNFFVESFYQAFSGFVLSPHLQTLKIILPVGISFYTFQALSYSIDVYRGHIKPTCDPVAFFAYVSFFPQLVAGPIERATNLLPQFLAPRSFSYPQAVDGCQQMLWGFFKKMVVADNSALVANAIFDGYESRPAGALVIGSIFFAFQIYGDFSGYSDIAIGCSRLFGIRLMRNFAYPYFARDIAEFWRLWHISLSTWFRDYLYIPLGGSRGGVLQQVRNVFAIFLVSGLWHGANWTYVVWGAVHACCFMPLLLGRKNRQYLGPVAADRRFPSVVELAQMAYTFLFVVLAWVFFRASSMAAALDILFRIATVHGGIIPYRAAGFVAVLPWIFLLIGVEWAGRREQHGLQKLPQKRWMRWGLYYLLGVVILLFKGTQASFIYFQF